MSIANIMGPLGLLSSLAGVGNSFLSGRRSARAFDVPKGFGRQTGTADYTPLTQTLPDDQAATAQDLLGQAARTVPGAGLAITQQQANQAALDAQKPYANAAIDNVRNSSAAAADTFVKDKFNFAGPGGPQAISQQTFDQMAARIAEENSGRVAARNNAADSWAARTGASPEAIVQTRNENAVAGDQDYAKALRDLMVQRESTNADYGLNLGRLAASLTGAYTDPLNAALNVRGGLEQPADFQSIGDSMLNYFLNSVNSRTATDTANTNTLVGLGGGLLNNWASDRSAQQIAAAQPGIGSAIAPAATIGGIGYLTELDKMFAGLP